MILRRSNRLEEQVLTTEDGLQLTWNGRTLIANTQGHIGNEPKSTTHIPAHLTPLFFGMLGVKSTLTNNRASPFPMASHAVMLILGLLLMLPVPFLEWQHLLPLSFLGWSCPNPYP